MWKPNWRVILRFHHQRDDKRDSRFPSSGRRGLQVTFKEVTYPFSFKGTTVPLRIYPTCLSTLSPKRLSEKKEDHHGEAVRQVQRHGYFKIAASPGQPLRDGLAGYPYEGFYLNH